MAKLMVLGAGFPQVKLMEAARELGYETVVASIPGNYPGFDTADQIEYADISKPEEVLEAARRQKIDGIATCCLDTGIRSLGYVCEEMGLPGLSKRAALLCNDKKLMKDAFAAHNVNTAAFFYIRSREDLQQSLQKLGFPVVLKAVDLQGSNGVYICHEEAELEEAYEAVGRLSRADYCILEEYLTGYELGAQAFVYHGKILFILPHGDNTYMSRTAIPIGHYVPLEISEELQKAVVTECEKAIRALELDNCAVNIDLIEKDGKIYLIELTGRAGATALPELVSIYYGLDYYKMIAILAMGGDAEQFFAGREDRHVANASRMLLSEQDGVIRKLSFDFDPEADEDIYDFSFIVKEGDTVSRFTTARDRIGQVIVKGRTYEACEEKIQRILSGIHITLG